MKSDKCDYLCSVFFFRSGKRFIGQVYMGPSLPRIHDCICHGISNHDLVQLKGLWILKKIIIVIVQCERIKFEINSPFSLNSFPFFTDMVSVSVSQWGSHKLSCYVMFQKISVIFCDQLNAPDLYFAREWKTGREWLFFVLVICRKLKAQVSLLHWEYL